MYINNNNGNSKRQTRTKLTDMGVVVIDEEHLSNGTYSNEINGKSKSEQQSNQQQTNQDEAKQSLLNEGDAPVDMTLVTVKEKRNRFKRVLIAGGVTVGLFCLLFGAAYLWLSNGSRQSEEHKVSANNSSSNKANEQPQGITTEEISQELNKHTAEKENQTAQTSANPTDGSSPDNSSSSPITDRLPNEHLSATVNSNDAANRNGNDLATSTTADTTSQSASYSNNAASNRASVNNSSPTVSSSQDNSSFALTRSIRVSALQPDKTEVGKSTNKPQSESEGITTSQESRATRKTNSIVLPPFGTMLPVRTVGTVFTLRSDSYVRLQLMRDISGQGWVLKRGTEFYGTVKSADIETARAFISIVGFVDPNTNRFVRLQGSIIGSDGADGVRGKKHKLNSGWINALKKVGQEVLDTAKSAASGIGRRPVIITETSPRIVDPIAEEIEGLVVNKNGFVEIPAGTTCYVSVTSLPNEIQGVDAVGDVSLPDENVSKANQLSEQEIAALLINGNKEEIRLALPRMSVQMRRVAEALLVNK